tara:strand:+ start:656 stop:1222 length:567 start_codon:yes stop_codon:yes gene_type:complete
MVKKCEWPTGNELMMKYHDEEWGMPVHDDKELFEFLVLETAQAGLSWQTILNRREGYRKAFANFDYEKVAKFGDKDVERLMNDVGIIRNRLKIASTITNAQNFIKIRGEFGSFDKYIWAFVGGKQIVNKASKMGDIEANTEISDNMSKDLKVRGFKFVGSTIMYAFMQAAGLVNDHVVRCYRYKECQK